jgi:UDP-N-acetylglucosamine acyltransferase
MTQVHPSAIVDDMVEMGHDVAIGPQCIVHGRVKIGAGTKLLHRVTLHGPLTLGKRNKIYPNACIGFAPQDRKFDPMMEGAGIEIGEDNILREGVTVHRATGQRPTIIGNRNYLMANSHVGHDCIVGDDVTLANGALLGGHAQVGDRAILGGNAAVHQFCRVGRLAMLTGGGVVTQDLPPFCVAYATKSVGSLNVVGLRRAELSKHTRPLQRAFDLAFRSQLARPTAIQRILAELGDDPLCVEMAEFLRTSKRGISPYGGRRGHAEAADTMDAQV